MSEQKNVSTHYRFWLFSAGIFLLLVLAAAGPLVFKAMADFSAAEQQAVQVKNAAITQAITNNDYAAWSALVDDTELKAQVNASNFADFKAAYLLLEKGKIDEANLLKKQIGLREQIANTSVVSALMTDAIARKDYNAWRNIVGPDYAKNVVTASNFEEYARALDAAGRGKLNITTRLQYSLSLKQKLDYSSSRY